MNKEYWNNKHPKKPIIYNGRAIPNRDGLIPIDVRQMFWAEDYMLSDIIEKNNLIGKTMDETALLCQKYIVDNYQYVSDITSVNYNEYWQFPNETLYLRSGDCEDGSLLMASLMCSAGIPIWRVRVNAGWVIDSHNQQQGHAYVSYCRCTDDEWVILDWCYHQDPMVAVIDKPLARDIHCYRDIWWSFNSRYSWSHKRYESFSSIDKEPRTTKEMR